MAVKFESNKKDVVNRLDNLEIEALNKIGEFVRQKAHDAAPVAGSTSADGRYKSEIDPESVTRPGVLRDSIKSQVDEKEKSVQVGSHIIFAPTVELGSSKQKAQPYITPAAEENIQEIGTMAKDALRKMGE